jgi:hypothetical protein
MGRAGPRVLGHRGVLLNVEESAQHSPCSDPL